MNILPAQPTKEETEELQREEVRQRKELQALERKRQSAALKETRQREKLAKEKQAKQAAAAKKKLLAARQKAQLKAMAQQKAQQLQVQQLQAQKLLQARQQEQQQQMERQRLQQMERQRELQLQAQAVHTQAQSGHYKQNLAQLQQPGSAGAAPAAAQMPGKISLDADGFVSVTAQGGVVHVATDALFLEPGAVQFGAKGFRVRAPRRGG